MRREKPQAFYDWEALQAELKLPPLDPRVLSRDEKKAIGRRLEMVENHRKMLVATLAKKSQDRKDRLQQREIVRVLAALISSEVKRVSAVVSGPGGQLELFGGE